MIGLVNVVFSGEGVLGTDYNAYRPTGFSADDKSIGSNWRKNNSTPWTQNSGFVGANYVVNLLPFSEIASVRFYGTYYDSNQLANTFDVTVRIGNSPVFLYYENNYYFAWVQWGSAVSTAGQFGPTLFVRNNGAAGSTNVANINVEVSSRVAYMVNFKMPQVTTVGTHSVTAHWFTKGNDNTFSEIPYDANKYFTNTGRYYFGFTYDGNSGFDEIDSYVLDGVVRTCGQQCDDGWWNGQLTSSIMIEKIMGIQEFDAPWEDALQWVTLLGGVEELAVMYLLEIDVAADNVIELTPNVGEKNFWQYFPNGLPSGIEFWAVNSTFRTHLDYKINNPEKYFYVGFQTLLVRHTLPGAFKIAEGYSYVSGGVIAYGPNGSVLRNYTGHSNSYWTDANVDYDEPTATPAGQVTFSFPTVAQDTDVTVTVSRLNCTSSHGDTIVVPRGDGITITFTANTNCVFNNPPVGSDGTIGVVNTGGETAYIVLSNVQSNITVNATAVGVTPEPTQHSITVSRLNCVSDSPDYILVSEGDGYTITFTANSGYYFANPPYGTGVTGVITNNGAGAYISFSNIIGDLFVNATAVVIPTPGPGPGPDPGPSPEPTPGVITNEGTGFVNIYNPSDAQLVAAANCIFYDDIGGESPKVVDTSEYVLKCYKTYAPVSVTGADYIQFFIYKTNVLANVISGYIVEVDLGSVDIEEYYHNSLDYDSTNIRLWLPFIGFVSLETSDVMGETINLKYKFNLLTTSIIAWISTSVGVIGVWTGTCSEDIPVSGSYDGLSSFSSLAQTALSMANRRAYVMLDENFNTAPNRSNLNVISNNVVTTISALSGFVICSEVFAGGINCYNEELIMIENLLKNGIIV